MHGSNGQRVLREGTAGARDLERVQAGLRDLVGVQREQPQLRRRGHRLGHRQRARAPDLRPCTRQSCGGSPPVRGCRSGGSQGTLQGTLGRTRTTPTG